MKSDAGRHREHRRRAGSGRRCRARRSRGSSSGARGRTPPSPRRSRRRPPGTGPTRNADRFSTMSISSAPSATARRISVSRRSSADEPRRERARHARDAARPCPRTRVGRDSDERGVHADRGDRRHARVERVRAHGLARRARATLPGVSAPSSVVRSTHRIARSSAARFDDVLIERPASAAARDSSITPSTGVTVMPRLQVRATARPGGPARRSPGHRTGGPLQTRSGAAPGGRAARCGSARGTTTSK